MDYIVQKPFPFSLVKLNVFRPTLVPIFFLPIHKKA